MIKSSKVRPFLCALTLLSVLTGCSRDRPAEEAGPDAAPTETVVRLTEQEYVNEHAGRGILIDVRTPDEYAAGHLVDSKHIDVLDDDFRARVDSLDRNSTYYLYCRTGNRSGRAAEAMAEMGFRSLYNVGGFAELAEAGADTTR